MYIYIKSERVMGNRMFWLTLQQVSGQSGFSSSRTDKVGQDRVHIQSHVIMNLQCRRGHQEREKTGEQFSLTAEGLFRPHLKSKRRRATDSEAMFKLWLCASYWCTLPEICWLQQSHVFPVTSAVELSWTLQFALQRICNSLERWLLW